MAQFRKKPVVIEAARWLSTMTLGDLPEWARPHGYVHVDVAGTLTITTLKGQMRADRGDWIIRGVKGELYPCKPDIFAATYDPV